KRILAAGAILFLLVFAHDAFPQQPPFSRDALISAAREIMISTRYCALITTGSAGVHARAMDPFPPEDDMTVWFGTNSRSRKVREIRRQPRVTLYYFNRENQEYVVLTGVARVVNDPKEKAKRWKDEWNSFYPNRAKDYLLIEFKPDTLEVVSEKKKIFGDPVTWKPPRVRIPSRKAKR
ncbi:MAG TPA: pyridoxamine 5'-phosphate oxidase family protein, partial [Pyrinomonadaceae bacterium]|nr:pyridoxamine 5'-phosphate oxidase family protein [Pyrinomonadaceae bacterium]